MKRSILKSLFFLVFAAIGYSKVTSFPPNARDLEGIWVGISPEANSFYRLHLSKGDGLFAFSFSEERPKLYEISAWNLDSHGLLAISILPRTTNAYAVLLTGKASAPGLQISVKDPKGGWKHEVMLYREDFIERGMQALKAAMQQSAKKEQP